MTLPLSYSRLRARLLRLARLRRAGPYLAPCLPHWLGAAAGSPASRAVFPSLARRCGAAGPHLAPMLASPARRWAGRPASRAAVLPHWLGATAGTSAFSRHAFPLTSPLGDKISDSARAHSSPSLASQRSSLASRRAKVGGEGRTRTFEAARATDLQSAAFDRFATSPTVCLLGIRAFDALPCGPMFTRHWSWRRDLNPRPADYKSAALPTELRQPKIRQKLDFSTSCARRAQ